MNRSLLGKSFQEYVAGYDTADPKIQLKVSHSYRVADLSAQIAEAVEGADPDFAWVTGLLHDIGRFEQVRRYNTFIDADSVDHAQLGARQLFHEGLLERLYGGAPDWEHDDPAREHRHLMETAIRCHSAYQLPEGLSGPETTYCDILRDADKIDIFRVLCDTPAEKIYNEPSEALRTSAVSDEVRECFLTRATVLRTKRKTPIDKIAGHICLFFGLVYPTSRQLAKEQGYLDQLLAFQSDNRETQKWFEYMREHIWE